MPLLGQTHRHQGTETYIEETDSVLCVLWEAIDTEIPEVAKLEASHPRWLIGNTSFSSCSSLQSYLINSGDFHLIVTIWYLGLVLGAEI